MTNEAALLATGAGFVAGSGCFLPCCYPAQDETVSVEVEAPRAASKMSQRADCARCTHRVGRA